MKKILLVALFINVITGCSYLSSRAATDPISESEQICLGLKRNIVFNTTTTSNFGSASATQHAEALRLYDKYGCDKIVSK